MTCRANANNFKALQCDLSVPQTLLFRFLLSSCLIISMALDQRPSLCCSYTVRNDHDPVVGSTMRKLRSADPDIYQSEIHDMLARDRVSCNAYYLHRLGRVWLSQVMQ